MPRHIPHGYLFSCNEKTYMVKRGIIGRITRDKDPNCSFVAFTFRQAKWHGRERLPGVKGKSVYIPLSKPQLSRLTDFTNKIRAVAPDPSGLPRNSFGYVSLAIDHAEKRVLWFDFTPFERESPAIKSPTGVGIGDLIHYAIVKHLKEQYKNHVVNHVPESVSADRVKQLARMGIDVKKTYKIRDYHDKVRAYIERVRREKRATAKEEKNK